ncbi:unnamed protein product [Nippostrongylus brasiliensis]|uniref:SEL-1 like protein (inferred by orthology to a S. mansoni protein) n=1 Tax=Nippostrongylus brasiliensis TaxID=27835 RepID=A0A0N4YTD8_NIPBR|nr:unnamed protein product [Nippostrongylus brasiliensis]
MVTIKKVKKVKKAGSSQKEKIIPQAEVNTKSNRKRKLAVESSETKDVVDKKSSVIDEKPTKTTKKDDADKVKEIKEQGQVAIKALKKHLADRSGKSLFPDIDHAVGLTIVYKKPALTTDKARVKIELPCPYRTPLNTSICLIMPDLDQTAAGRRDPDVDKQARQWAEKIEKDHGLTNQHYSKVCMISQSFFSLQLRLLRIALFLFMQNSCFLSNLVAALSFTTFIVLQVLPNYKLEKANSAVVFVVFISCDHLL